MATIEDDLFKPLSAKVGRKQWSSGGREKDTGRAAMGEARRIGNALARRKEQAMKQAKGQKA